MKKTNKILIVVLACIMMFSLCACNNTAGNGEDETKTYTIQYADNSGIHTIEVQSGNLYSITSIPEKKGYDFMGLFDAETDGTQYINSSGISVSAFTGKQNIVLYPQFKAKEYTLVLDYQGAAVTGGRSLTVSYDSVINDLPMNLTIANKDFMGWYTEPNKQGTQVADQYGMIPSKNVIDESVFDLSDPKGYIYLYAGFKGEEFTVTFYPTANGAPEEVKVEYGTPISQVQIEARVDGNAVISWSKKKNDTNKDEIFNGKVTSEMVLYAAEYAPVIDFDSNGGKAVNSVIAHEGDTISLSTPVKENYKFVGWQTASGEVVDYKIMPSSSVRLTAKWQAIIAFDTNGGTEVNNISEPQGTKVVLPETEKDGFMFAGWYDGNGNKYESTAMPSKSVNLYAKYWEMCEMTKVFYAEGTWYTFSDGQKGNKTYRAALDLSNLYDGAIRDIRLTVHYKLRTRDYVARTELYWYSEDEASSAYELWCDTQDQSEKNTVHAYSSMKVLKLTTKQIFVYRYGRNLGEAISDWWVLIEYPDITKLY